MSRPAAHVRETGAGPGVVCLHANASSSSQWRGLMDILGASHHVLAPDAYGSGKSPQWSFERPMTLGDEAVLIEPALAKAGSPLVLVGHSYGGAVALVAALQQPQRVRAMVLYEPTLFALVDARRPPPNEADGIRRTAAVASEALARGDADLAAQYFVDFWAGAGTWGATAPQRKAAIASSIVNLPHWAHALFNEPAPLQAFRTLNFPILCMLGERSPESSRAVSELLVPVLPQARVVRFPGLGHMGPVTHPETVNAAIASFLSTL